MKIGVFDSGLGGLTVVKSIIAKFPNAKIIYIADTAYAPYGDRSDTQIRQRSLKISEYLIKNHAIDALVVACNSATSAAISTLRENYPNLLIVGTEPGIKPAILSSKSKKVGVMATSATLLGEKYRALADMLVDANDNIELFEQACPGLVEQIENDKLDTKESKQLLKNWLRPMKDAGVDTIVLGCTHYPIASRQIRDIMGGDVVLIETGEAISNRLKELTKDKDFGVEGGLLLFATSHINSNIASKILDRKVEFEMLTKIST